MKRLVFLLVWIAGLLLWSTAVPIQAADLIISADCSLAQAIAAANSDSAVGACPAGNGHDTVGLTDDIVLSAALPAVRSQVTIDGDGHSISGDELHRIFDANGGRLTVKNVTLAKGKAPDRENGGAIRLRNGAQVSVENSSLDENAAFKGGAIALERGAELTIRTSSLRGNKATTGGGAIYASGGSVRVTDSDFSANCVTRATQKVTPDRSKAEVSRTVDGDGCLRFAYSWPSPEAMVTTEEGDGGAISIMNGARVVLENVSFSNNKATSGGAITSANRSGALTVTGSSFSGNVAVSLGGAMVMHGGTVEIANSSFVKNNADHVGGMLHIEAGAVHITNTTINGNRARDGGVAALYGGELTVTHATMKDNVAVQSGASTIANRGGAVKLRNSIIDGSVSNEDCIGALDEIVSTLSRDGTCGIFRSDDALLGNLTGEPAWHPLEDGSPAIDAADPAYCPEADQRGTARPYGAGCDIGAVETTTAAPPIPDPLAEICPLDEQIVAANTDAPFKTCPAGDGPDVFYLTRDITLDALLPQITSDITIEGNGYTLSGAGRFRIFDVRAGKLTINNLTLADGETGPKHFQQGGAIRLRGSARVDINDSTFRNNMSLYGGAIAVNDKTTRLFINRSSFVGNEALESGGAIYSMGGGKISISNSSFVGNRTKTGGSKGGAISAEDAIFVDISNSTFIGNVAVIGGAIHGGSPTSFFRSTLNLTLTHVTMLENAGWGTGLYIEKNNLGSIRVLNSVIVGRGKIAHCYAQLVQNAGNFIADGTCAPKLSGDPMLEARSDLQGYVSPMAGSPLIRAAHPSFCHRTDQLGNARAIEGRCDIGAIEYMPVRRPLSDCTVRTTSGVNLRDAPNGERIGAVPVGATLAASARTPRWVQVDRQGTIGWISADYVTTQGSCD